jgi:CHAT domain-containing protein
LARSAQQIKGRDLIIVPDGPLHHLPFESLLVNFDEQSMADRPDYSALPYLINSHAISYSYSATLRAILRDRTQPEPDRGFAGIAPGSYDTSSSAESMWSSSTNPLPGAKREVRRLRSLFSPSYNPLGRLLDSRNELWLGENANEESLAEGQLHGYKYIHFATHGILNDSIPELSGLLLHPSSTTSDDVLHLGEIYSLDLNADLVVLSACDTGKGKVVDGEGVVGLAGGLLFAGAKNVVVSLWQVDDSVAGEVMIPFYIRFLRNAPYRRALRDAKLEIIKGGGRSARPYYWAPYVLFDS